MQISECPVCKTEMIPLRHDDIEFDYCPKCHGTWLDRKNLERLLHPLVAAKGKKRADNDDRPHFGKRRGNGLPNI